MTLKTVHYETFSFDDDQYENLWAALDRAAQIAGKRNLSQALGERVPKSLLLDMIIVDFLATNDFAKTNDPVNVLRYLQRIERSLGVRLVALDPDTRKVLYGMETVEWAAGE